MGNALAQKQGQLIPYTMVLSVKRSAINELVVSVLNH